MKNKLVVAFLFSFTALFTGTQGYAQLPGTIQTVSKNGLTEKIEQLNALLEQNKTDEAKTKSKELNQMMADEIGTTLKKIREADQTKNEANKKRYSAIMEHQRTVYGDILQLSADMAMNKQTVVNKLREFTAIGY